MESNSLDGNDFFKVFDGCDVGVTLNDIDGLFWINENTFLITYDKSFTLDGFGQLDEQDIFQFNATSLGEVTNSSWTVNFDDSDVGLTHPSEDIDAIFLRPEGTLLISTNGNFSVPVASGNGSLSALA